MVPQLFTVYVGALVYFLSSVHMVPEYCHFHRYIVINNIKYVFIAMSIYHGFGMRVSIHIWACIPTKICNITKYLNISKDYLIQN
jgi:hypothetical protein